MLYFIKVKPPGFAFKNTIDQLCSPFPASHPSVSHRSWNGEDIPIINDFFLEVLSAEKRALRGDYVREGLGREEKKVGVPWGVGSAWEREKDGEGHQWQVIVINQILFIILDGNKRREEDGNHGTEKLAEDERNRDQVGEDSGGRKRR